MNKNIQNPMDQWDDYFPPLNLWNYNLYYSWFPYYDKDIPIEEIVKDLMVVESRKGKK